MTIADNAHGMRGSRAAVADTPWPLRYLAVPFRERGRDFDGADCWGLVLLILAQERGVIVPEPAQLYASTQLRAASELRAFFAEAAHRWRRLPAPEPWSVLLFGVEVSGRTTPAHVGLSLGGRSFIHTQDGYGVQMSSLDERRAGDAAWADRLLGAFTYDG